MQDKTSIDRSTTPPTLIVISETRIPLFKLQSLQDAEKRTRERGSHYFDADTTHFFKARYHAERCLSDGSIMIVESTKRTGFRAPDGAREYRVMRVSIEGEIFHYPGLSGGVGVTFTTAAKACRDMDRKTEEFRTFGMIKGER